MQSGVSHATNCTVYLGLAFDMTAKVMTGRPMIVKATTAKLMAAMATCFSEATIFARCSVSGEKFEVCEKVYGCGRHPKKGEVVA